MAIVNSVKRLARRIGTVAREFRYRNQPEKIVALGYDEMAGDYGSWALRHERHDRDTYTNLLFEHLPDGQLIEPYSSHYKSPRIEIAAIP